MSDDKLIKRLEELIAKGETVLSTLEGNQVGGTVNNDIFQEWRVGSLSLLQKVFGKDSAIPEEFKDRCNDKYFVEAETGLSILKAAKEELKAGDIF